MHDVVTMWHYAMSRTLGLLPWFLLAVVLGRVLQHIRMDVLMQGSLKRRNAAAAVTTTAFGAFTPFCACSVVPLIRGSLEAGVPVSVAMSFWIASPAMAPEIFALSAKAFGTDVAVARTVGAVALGLGSALIAHVMQSRGWLDQVLRPAKSRSSRACCAPTEPTSEPSCCDAVTPDTSSACCSSAAASAAPPRELVLVGTGVAVEGSSSARSSDAAGPSAAPGVVVFSGTAVQRRWRPQAKEGLQRVSVWDFGEEVVRDSWFLGRWMLMAIVLETLVVHYVAPASFRGLLGGNILVSVTVAALLSIPLYLNGISAIPIGAGLIAMGMSSAGLTTFLLAGAITTLPAMAAVNAVVTRRVFTLYVATGVFGSIVIGLLAAPFLN